MFVTNLKYLLPFYTKGQPKRMAFIRG